MPACDAAATENLVRWQVLALQLLPDAPEAAGWAAEATNLCEAVNARPYLERLRQGRGGTSAAARTSVAADRSEEPVPDPS